MNPRRRNSPSVKILKPQVFLMSQNTQNLLDLPELSFFSRGDRRLRIALQQLFRAEKAADLVGSIFEGHSLLF